MPIKVTAKADAEGRATQRDSELARLLLEQWLDKRRCVPVLVRIEMCRLTADEQPEAFELSLQLATSVPA
jgi:hypothetical protein